MSTYHGWNIECWPKPIPVRDHDWEASLDEGTCITGATEQALKNEIDYMCELMDAQLRSEP